MKPLKFLIIGCGSIGQRHLRNLSKFKNLRLFAYDVDPQKVGQLKEISSQIIASTNLDVLWTHAPDACLITVPTALHLAYVQCAVDHGCHLFIEKPLGASTHGWEKLLHRIKDNKLKTFIGYNYRFHPYIIKIHDMLKRNQCGQIVFCRSHFGSYLPDRHPGEDYRRGYGARKELGGGVILDALSHHYDIWCFLFGKPLEVIGNHGKCSDLEIDVEDYVNMTIRYTNNNIVSLHANFLERPVRNTIEIIGTKGSIFCDLAAKEIRFYNISNKKWHPICEACDFNEAYIQEMKTFVGCIKQNYEPPVPIETAYEELKVLLKIKQTRILRKWVSI